MGILVTLQDWMAQADRVRSANVTKILILTLLATVIGNYRLISRASVVVIVWYNTNKMFLTENTGLIESQWNTVTQGSPNQAKWATSSPWFQWSRPISVKKWSFSRPVSLFKSVFFSPIIILFLQYSHKRSSHVPEMWPIQGLMFNILFQTR